MTAIHQFTRLNARMADGTGHIYECTPIDSAMDDADSASRICSGDVQSFTPQAFDVLLGRGRWYASHAGNRRLQVFINMYLERYQGTTSRPEKTYITNEILHMVKTCGKQPGRFLKFDEEIKGWVGVSDEVARLKVSQAMRYTIRSPQEGGILPSMQDPSPRKLEANRDDHYVNSPVKSYDENAIGDSHERLRATSRGMDRPLPHLPAASVVQSRIKNSDEFCSDDHDNRSNDDEDIDDCDDSNARLRATSRDMGRPLPHLPAASVVQARFKNGDGFCSEDHDNRSNEDEDIDDCDDQEGKLMSDEAILSSLGYSVPKPKKRKSTGDIPFSHYAL